MRDGLCMEYQPKLIIGIYRRSICVSKKMLLNSNTKITTSLMIKSVQMRLTIVIDRVTKRNVEDREKKRPRDLDQNRDRDYDHRERPVR
jgi:hypothetical protein